jgi:hypothetical protein
MAKPDRVCVSHFIINDPTVDPHRRDATGPTRHHPMTIGTVAPGERGETPDSKSLFSLSSGFQSSFLALLPMMEWIPAFFNLHRGSVTKS